MAMNSISAYPRHIQPPKPDAVNPPKTPQDNFNLGGMPDFGDRNKYPLDLFMADYMPEQIVDDSVSHPNNGHAGHRHVDFNKGAVADSASDEAWCQIRWRQISPNVREECERLGHDHDDDDEHHPPVSRWGVGMPPAVVSLLNRLLSRHGL